MIVKYRKMVINIEGALIKKEFGLGAGVSEGLVNVPFFDLGGGYILTCFMIIL